jgi:hypothetical protein
VKTVLHPRTTGRIQQYRKCPRGHTSFTLVIRGVECVLQILFHFVLGKYDVDSLLFYSEGRNQLQHGEKYLFGSFVSRDILKEEARVSAAGVKEGQGPHSRLASHAAPCASRRVASSWGIEDLGRRDRLGAD